MSLNEDSGFNDLLNVYQTNKERPWSEWLKVERILPRPGKQGLVGIMTTEDGKKYVFKLSQYLNYLVQHEYTVMKSLTDISHFCPHYCRVVGTMTCEVDPFKRKEGNPFEIDRYQVEKDVLLMEYIPNSYKLYNYIFNDNVSEEILFGLVRQTLMAISIAQRKKKFTHYDLHSNNVMIKKCSRDLVFLYILDEENQFCVPTHGCYPVLIDFGFAYSEDLDSGPMWPTLNHTDAGFVSDRFDPIADPKLFLVTVADEIHESKKTKRTKKLLNIVKNNYCSLPIDWESGWDNYTDSCVTDKVLKKLQPYESVSNLFKEYEYYWLDLITSLIILPLQEQNYSNLELSFTTFVKEFSKIEDEISNPFFCLYILRGIVDSARVIQHDYARPSTRETAVAYFKRAVFERVDTVVSHCMLKTVHFEKMLCSLFCLVRAIEGILYEEMEKIMNRKRRWYSKIPLQTPEELVGVIDINIPDNYTFTERTKVIVIDCIREDCYPYELDKDKIEELNSIDTVSRGSELFSELKNNFDQINVENHD